MVKHFENLWEESEHTTFLSEIHKDDIFSSLEESLKELKQSESKEDNIHLIGTILYFISALSKKYDINVYDALLRKMQDEKIELFEKNSNI